MDLLPEIPRMALHTPHEYQPVKLPSASLTDTETSTVPPIEEEFHEASILLKEPPRSTSLEIKVPSVAPSTSFRPWSLNSTDTYSPSNSLAENMVDLLKRRTSFL
jgi:hypothetical protein